MNISSLHCELEAAATATAVPAAAAAVADLHRFMLVSSPEGTNLCVGLVHLHVFCSIHTLQMGRRCSEPGHKTQMS